MNRSNANRKSKRNGSEGQRSQARSGTTHDRDLALRKTGIRVMGEMPWGTHICLFYETKKDLLDAAVFYFQAGLDSNEFCIWAVSDPISIEVAKRALAQLAQLGLELGSRFVAAGVTDQGLARPDSAEMGV